MIALVLSVIVSVSIFFGPKKYSRLYVYWLIPINVLADSLVGFSGDGSTHSGIIRAGLIYPYMLLSLLKIKSKQDHKILFGFLIYLGILTTMSSNPDYSFWQLLKVSSGFLMYPLAFIYIKTVEDIRRLYRSMLVAGGIVVFNFLIAQVFKIGESPYVGGLVYIGAGLVQITYVLSYVCVLSPLMLDKSSGVKSKYIYAVLSSGVLQMLLTFRRSSILAVILGVAVMAFTLGHKKQVIKAAMIATLMFGALYAFKGDLIDKIISARMNIDQELSSKGGRVHEFSIVAEPFLEFDLKRMLIGTEVFNTINLPEFVQLDGKGRPLHVDFNILIHGSGIIGLFWYLYFHFRIWRFNRKAERLTRDQEGFKNFNGVFLGLLSAHFVISMSNQFFVLTSLSTLFLLLGSLNSVRYYSFLYLNK